MSDEVRDRESGVAAATVNENQKLASSRRTDHETSSKSETAEGKRPQESRRWEKAGRKKQTSKSSTRARNKTRNSRERKGK